MMPGATATQNSSTPRHDLRVRFPISPRQQSFEREAGRLRNELNLSPLECLPHEDALRTVPNCEITALKNIPQQTLPALVHFRTVGYHIGAFAAKNADGCIDIVFNDAHPPTAVRVYLLEEIFHLRFGHPFDEIRIYPGYRASRTYSQAKEDEAYGCAVAALVPYQGLEAMLGMDLHISRIAEIYAVPVPVVEFRITATNLGRLVARIGHDSPIALSARY
jgi:hypothetical protein